MAIFSYRPVKLKTGAFGTGPEQTANSVMVRTSRPPLLEARWSGKRWDTPAQAKTITVERNVQKFIVAPRREKLTKDERGD